MRRFVVVVLACCVAGLAWYFYRAIAEPAFHARVNQLQAALRSHQTDFPDVKVAYSTSHQVESVQFLGTVRNAAEIHRLDDFLSSEFGRTEAERIVRGVRVEQPAIP